MDDIISLGLETMEVQTVRMVAPQHLNIWQAGVLANKAGFEMNIHGPYYSNYSATDSKETEVWQRSKLLYKRRTNPLRHPLHAGHYGETGRGQAANEQVASVFKESSKSMKFGTMTKGNLYSLG